MKRIHSVIHQTGAASLLSISPGESDFWHFLCSFLELLRVNSNSVVPLLVKCLFCYGLLQKGTKEVVCEV